MLGSCYKRESIPNTPQISLDNINSRHLKKGTDSFTLTIGYKDGDGDLGLGQGDTFPPFNASSYYYSDLYIYYLVRSNGIYVPWVPKNSLFSNLDTVFYDYRIGVLNDSKRAQPISGNINVGLVVTDSINDNIKFRIFLFDRALHESNIIETAAIRRKID
jgi:hypothetical protein